MQIVEDARVRRGTGEFAKWPAKSSMTRAKLGLASNGMPWTDMGKQFRGVPKSMRQHDVINVCYWARRLESKLPLNELVKETYVNFS